MLRNTTTALGLLAATVLGCAQAQERTEHITEQESDLPPAGYGTLRQEQVSVGLQSDAVQIQVVPLDEGIIRLLAQDTYNSLHRLRESKAEEIEQTATRYGMRQPQLFLVTFFGLQQEARFEPEDLMVMSQNRMFRPLHIMPLSPTWSGRQLNQRETATAVYLYDEGIRITGPIVVEYNVTRSRRWEQILRVVDRERAAVLSRAAAERRP
jgi:hypothetical protein